LIDMLHFLATAARVRRPLSPWVRVSFLDRLAPAPRAGDDGNRDEFGKSDSGSEKTVSA
jgi:hypothetical protein